MAGVQTQPLDIPKGIQASETRTIAAGSHKSERGRLYQPSSKAHRHLLVCELADRYRLLPCGRMPLVGEVCELVRGPAWGIRPFFIFTSCFHFVEWGVRAFRHGTHCKEARRGCPWSRWPDSNRRDADKESAAHTLESSGIKPGETELPRIRRRRAAPSFSLPGKVPMKWSFFKAYVTFYHDVLQKDKNKPVH